MKREDNFKKKGFMKEMISGENGIISSKRVMGVVVLIVCMICTCWLVWAEGGTTVVENLLQTLMVMAAALLGISSITGIWKKGEKTEIKAEEPPKSDSEDPCEKCIHNTEKDQS